MKIITGRIIDSTIINHINIYKRDTMVINVIKSHIGIAVQLRHLNFRKGIYTIDLKKFYNLYGRNNSFIIENFPFDCIKYKRKLINCLYRKK